MSEKRRGRPTKGHAGHPGRPDRCEACRLREWRLARGLTQAGLARLLSSDARPGTRWATHPRTVQRWERGERRLPPLLFRYLMVAELDLPVAPLTAGGRASRLTGW